MKNTNIIIALLQALKPKTAEQLTVNNGSADAGKILVVGPDGKVKTETLTEGSVVVDSEMSDASTNPVQNKVVTEYLELSSAQITNLTGLLD